MFGFAPYASAPFGAAGPNGAVLSRTFSDSATAADVAALASATFLAAVSGAAIATDAQTSASAVLNPTMTEAATGTDAASVAHGFAASISDTASLLDSAATSLDAIAQLSDFVHGVDAYLVTPSDFSAAFFDSAQAADAAQTTAVFNASAADAAAITDVAEGDYLWKIINDSQATDWAVVKTQS